MECIEKALNYYGVHTEWIGKLEVEHFTKGYDAIIGINNTLPAEKFEDGTFVVDLFQCPIFDLFVDAPYYHHKTLREHAENLHIIMLDEGHIRYCERYYQPLKSVSMACLPGPVEIAKNYKDREIDILFTGSLEDKNKWKEAVHTKYAGMWETDLFDKMIEIGLVEPNYSTEHVLRALLEANAVDYNDEQWKMLMNYFGIHSEIYFRGYYREKLITTLVDAGLNIHVVGKGWENLYSECPKNLILHGSVEFAEVAKMTANAKIILNVMPWFKDGMHDRILSGMMNGAVCVTDGSAYINSHFLDDEELLIYDLKEIDKLPVRLKQLLQNEERAKSIVEKGKKKAFENYSWNKIVEENILKYLI